MPRSRADRSNNLVLAERLGTAQACCLTERGIMEAMSKPSSRRFPVTVTQLPITRCQICLRTLAYRPGSITEILTEHYRRFHPEALAPPSREPFTNPRH